MSEDSVPRPSGNRSGGSTVIMFPKPRVGQGELIVIRLKNTGLEENIARYDGLPPVDEIAKLIRDETDNGNRRFIIDLSPAKWVNAEAVGWLIGTWRKIKEFGGAPVLIVASDRIMYVMISPN